MTKRYLCGLPIVRRQPFNQQSNALPSSDQRTSAELTPLPVEPALPGEPLLSIPRVLQAVCFSPPALLGANVAAWRTGVAATYALSAAIAGPLLSTAPISRPLATQRRPGDDLLARL